MAADEPVTVFFGPPDYQTRCQFGEIEYPDPNPMLGQVGPLILITKEQTERLLEGPSRHNGGIAQARYDGFGKRIFVDLAYYDKTWVWLLHPAVFEDGLGPAAFVGKWPD